MDPFVFPGRVGIVYKPLLKNRFQHLYQGMMNDPVPEGGHRDDPYFGFGDGKIPVFPRYIPAVDKVILEAE
jgi:hypothetical protein